MGFLGGLKKVAGAVGGALGGKKKEPPKEAEKDEGLRTWQRVSKVIGEGIAPSYAKGGKVRKTGMAKLHKGERVMTKSQTKRHGKCMGGK